jgi:sec-independent protein translocase protein TatB
MFGLGMGELLIILAIALILLGPKKLPDIAASLGKAIRSFRKATNDLGSQLEVDESVKQPFRELKAAIRDEPAPHPLAVQQPAESQPKEEAKAPEVKPPETPPPADDKKA